MKIQKTIVAVISSFFILTSCSAQKNKKQQLPYKDSSLPVEVRVNDLLERMTLEEKVSQMNMLSLKKLTFNKKGNVSKASLDSLFKGKSIGTLESPFIGVDEISKLSEAADHYLRNNTRLGIPAIQIAECLHGQLAFGATIFPQTIAQGSTWNPDLIKKMGATIASEATLSGVDQALSPIFDLARDPRYGRYEESFGEDPFLVAEMGKAFVIGMQGEPNITKDKIPDGKLMCTAKHYVAYSNPIAGINLGPNNLGPRDLRDLHLYPFKKVIQEANIYAVMPAYNEVNGIPLHSNTYLMKDILRDELGFKGYVFSDYEAIAMLNYFHKITKDASTTAIAALNAGIDLEAPSSFAYSQLPELVKTGKVDIALIDNAVRNILTAKFKAGLFDKPYKAPKKVSELIHTEASKNLAREIAEESIILLKNENNQLPLDASKLTSIAVIGPNADQVQYGDYSATKDNESGVTILEGIKNLTNNKVKINYAKGCDITGNDTSNIPKAVEAASKSDVVVLVIGGTSSTLSGIGWGKDIPNDYPTSGEGFDRASLTPPGVQSELIKAIYETGKPIVLVMVHGRAYSIPWEKEHIPAIIEAWYPGEEGGNAVANVLFGNVNPSGKLTVSIPKSVGHVPVFYNHKPSGRGFYKNPGSPEKPGRDYVFSSPDPLFPFGHGLSYTKFEYTNLKVDNTKLDANGDVKLAVTIKNAGKVTGKEVVQVYINDKISSITTPVKVLKAFKKIELQPSEYKTIEFSIPIKEFGLWDKDMNYIVEPGEFEIMIGSSAEDIRLNKTITIN
ncbi:glycosyl hydrolase [Aureibaculum marinum]|uniref:Glycosyl hydrolase n=1 Tax=Aureibaculum marinum TaxID=2487930 RepID=A0A3N4N630_9FLAO|nr:glycoside hydrolase family 3 N-terminal domain-containing protein [Aureibaculum marinum]RPD91762.1 glycosyl hydrolase [Aureibaculum marinum]